MNLHAAAHLARELMATHGLAGWTFAYDHARRRFGKCDYTHRRITLSRPLTFLNAEAEVRDTLLLELAPALTLGDGHGRGWRAACRRVGARPARCYTDAQVVSPPRPPAPYQLGCPKCGWWVDRRRRLPRGRAYRCTRCRGDAVFRERVA